MELNKESTIQKIYMGDTGLLVTHTFMDKKFMDNEIYRAVLLDKLNINEGMIMERDGVLHLPLYMAFFL